MSGLRPAGRSFAAKGLGSVLVVAVATVAAAQIALAARSASSSQAVTSGGAVVAVKMIGEGSLQNDGIAVGPTTHWTAIPGAIGNGTMLRVRITVPAGRRALFRATLSGDAWCSGGGEGACAVRVVANGHPFVPQSSDFGHVMTPDGNAYAANSTQFYTPHAYPAGTYTITAQAEFPLGGYMNFLSNVLTVDEIQAS